MQGRRVRPLLCVGRAEIREYLTAEHMDWCEDSTNQSADYTRNRIRSQVLPLLKETVNEQAEEHILQAGQIIGQADEYLRQRAAEIWRVAVSRQQESRDSESGARRNIADEMPERVIIPLAVFAAQPEILKMYLIRHMLDQLKPGWKDITSRHFTAIAKLAGKPVGSRVDLPGGLMARTGYETLEIAGKAEQKPVLDRETGGWGGNTVPQTAPKLHMTVFSRQKDQEIPKNQYTKWFDYDKIKDGLSIRYRKNGDYFTLSGGGKKKLGRFMIDEKIPEKERDRIPVLADGDHVLWVIGYRISDYYKITDETERVLEAEMILPDGGDRSEDGGGRAGIWNCKGEDHG